LKDAYSAEGETLYEAMQANPGYQGIKAPRTLRHRYLFEDVPFSMVPLASLGTQFGVETWATEAMVRLACVVHGTNYFARGRNVEDMGLKGLRVSEVKKYVQVGEINPIYNFEDVE
jgi:opine dehydrogenase